MTVEPWGFIPRIAAIRAEDSAEQAGVPGSPRHFEDSLSFPFLSKRGLGDQGQLNSMQVTIGRWGGVLITNLEVTFWPVKQSLLKHVPKVEATNSSLQCCR